LDIKDILKQVYYENTGTYPREGSAICEWLINPLTFLLQPLYDDINLLKQKNTLPIASPEEIDSLDDEVVDILASNFFVERRSGGKASGSVVLAFSQRVDVEIPQGTLVYTSKGKNFQVTRNHFFSSTQLTDTNGVFTTPPILVEAMDYGSDYEIGADEINNISLELPGLISVTNPAAFVGGIDRESNSQLIARIRDGLSGRSAATPAGIRYILSTYFPEITSVYVAGAGHPLMVRDRVYNVGSFNVLPYFNFDFTHKRAGGLTVPYAMKLFSADQVPLLTDFTTEFSQTDYDSIEILGGDTLVLSTERLFFDDFNRVDPDGNSIVVNSPGNGWRVGETGGNLTYGGIESVKVGNGELVLGNSVVASATTLDENQAKTISYGPSPVVQRKLPATNGIKVSGTFQTNATERRPSFVTVAKRSDATVARAYEGYGFAWTISDPEGRPNLFITDNAANDKHILLVGPELINTKGVESFLASTTATINPNTEYNFEMVLNLPTLGNEATAMEIRIWEVGASRPTMPTLQYGSYTPINKRNIDLQGNAQGIDAMDMGIGVLNGGSHLWTYKSIAVDSISEQRAHALFVMDVSQMIDNTGSASITLNCVYRGSGDTGGGTEGYGATLRVYNHSTQQWEVLDQNQSNTLKNLFETRLFDSDYISSNQISFALSSDYPHNGLSVVPVFSTLEIDYFGLKSFSTYQHLGSMVDVYIKRLGGAGYISTQESYVDIPSAPAVLRMYPGNGFNSPISRINSIEVLSGGSPSGIVLEENVDYRIMWVDQGRRGSIKENVAIIFKSSAIGLNLRINYDYFPDIDTIQAFMDSDSVKSVGQDLLVKHMYPIHVSVTMIANYTSQDMVNGLRKTIWDAYKTLEISDLIDTAYGYGASYVDLSALQVTSYYYDDNGNRIDQVHRNRIEIPDNYYLSPHNVVVLT
jgi:hypothetical protein